MSKQEIKQTMKRLEQEENERYQKVLKIPLKNKVDRSPIQEIKYLKLALKLSIPIIMIASVVVVSRWFDSNRLIWQSPILLRTPVYVEARQAVDKVLPTTEVVETTQKPTATPSPTPTPSKKAKVSAYSCGGLKTEAEIRMNCPSLLSGQPKTATGETPIAYKTMACDRANLGKTFNLDINSGIEIICNDTGGAIKGSGRFDLYVETVAEARAFGVKEIAYTLVEKE